MNTEEAWRTWWDAEGKHMQRLPHHDAMDHMASVTRIAWLNGAFDAADEIERLRKRLLAEENAYDIERKQNDHLQTDRNNLVLEVERLRAERDEARRDVCNMKDFNGLPRDYALERGWDCFKEQK